jgi:putative colanic acid biosynthesis acetyltransferase WcaF
MTDLKQVDNSLFRPTLVIGASKTKQMLWYISNVFFFKNPLNISSALKVFLLKIFGTKMGEGVVIKPAVNIKYPWKLTIGNHAWIGEHVWIDNLSEVSIGNHVTLSQGALLLTGSHDYKKITFDLMTHPITLEDGVWICAKSIVLGNTICRSHSVLGANSVASGELEAYIIYSGNPATPQKKRLVS